MIVRCIETRGGRAGRMRRSVFPCTGPSTAPFLDLRSVSSAQGSGLIEAAGWRSSVA